MREDGVGKRREDVRCDDEEREVVVEERGAEDDEQEAEGEDEGEGDDGFKAGHREGGVVRCGLAECVGRRVVRGRRCGGLEVVVGYAAESWRRAAVMGRTVGRGATGIGNAELRRNESTSTSFTDIREHVLVALGID